MMRELTEAEIGLVTGGHGSCSNNSGNDIAGVTDSKGFGQDLINIYEGLVQATSHIIERVANAFD